MSNVFFSSRIALHELFARDIILGHSIEESWYNMFFLRFPLLDFVGEGVDMFLEST